MGGLAGRDHPLRYDSYSMQSAGRLGTDRSNAARGCLGVGGVGKSSTILSVANVSLYGMRCGRDLDFRFDRWLSSGMGGDRAWRRTHLVGGWALGLLLGAGDIMEV